MIINNIPLFNLKYHYEAIKSLMHEQPELYLNNVAAEARGPAKEIMLWMKRYNDLKPESDSKI